MFVGEAAVRIGCTPAWVRALIAQKKLKAIKVAYRQDGYYWDIDPSSVTAYCNRKIKRGRPRKYDKGGRRNEPKFKT